MWPGSSVISSSPEIVAFEPLLQCTFVGPMDLPTCVEARVYRTWGFTALWGSPSQALPLFQHNMGKHISADVLNQLAQYGQTTGRTWGNTQHVIACPRGATSISSGQVH
jgi:hypothetical protein